MLIRTLYTVLLALVAPFFLVGLYKKKQGKPSFGKRWREHWGFTPPLAHHAPIWIHAVSVGESIAATPIIRALKERSPDQTIVVTTTTSTGAEQIQKLGDLVIHRYMPLDFSWCVRRFLRAINPSQLLIIETELWPNTLHQVAQKHIPITIVNARLSEHSCQRYQRFQFVFDQFTRNITKLLCQYPSDAERFRRLGIQDHQIEVTGSVKFDIQVTPDTERQGQQLREQLGKHRPVWIAASTHEGEDEQCLAAHRQLLKTHPDALLILVPRHPERFHAVAQLCEQQEFDVTKRTQHVPDFSEISSQIYLGDTMGEMLILMAASDICFMGGSLLGNKVGGHNLLEPAALKKPLLTGPSYFNFSEITQALLNQDAVVVCSDSDIISAQLQRLFDTPASAEKMGQSAFNVVQSNRGALERTLGHIMGMTHL